MQIRSVTPLAIPSVKVIRFGRFTDHRGYFTEPYRQSDFFGVAGVELPDGSEFVQMNESRSHKGVICGLHFQWNPSMGKLVRTVAGHMVDLFLDIRKGSPTYGKIAAYDMPDYPGQDYSEWLYVPTGFAHGNFFLADADTVIEYLCTGEYNPRCEAGISPLACDLDWSLCDQALKQHFDALVTGGPIITDRDRDGLSLAAWSSDERSKVFSYEGLVCT